MDRFKTLKDHVYDFIAEEILLGNLVPDEKINENIICDKLSISRTPVREALITLSADGILENAPRKGFVVKKITVKEAGELYLIIGALDGLAAGLATPYLTERELKEMQFYVESMNIAIESKNYEMYLKQQKAFHQVYIDKCRNNTLIEYIDKIKSKFINRNYLDDPDGEINRVLKETNAEHKKILELFAAGDASKVSEYLATVHWTPDNARFDLMSFSS